MADTSSVQIGALKESTWGTTPASALNARRFVSENLGKRAETIRSDEIDPTAMVTDIVRLGSNQDGGINLELSGQTYDEEFAAVLRSADFPAIDSMAETTISTSDTDNSFNDSATGFPALVVGQWIKVAGFTTAANNGFFQVVSRTTAKVVVTGGTLVTETAGDSVIIQSSTIANGVVQTSFTLEKNFSDITQFFYFQGCRIAELSLDLVSKAKITGTINYLGKAAAALAATTVGTGAYGAATTTRIMNASGHVAKVVENNAPLAPPVYAKSINWSYNTNLRIKDAVANTEAIGIGYGRSVVAGKMQAYFEDEVLFDKYMSDTTSSLAIPVQGPDGYAYVFSFPSIVFTNGDIISGGNDDDVLAELDWEAKKDATQLIMARIDRFNP
ncbi:hypothetical protein KAR91_14215 [Candidatus Pacearchaeota archaeon]|nr:hypothetical protein [Candidatus Pacearchaeota archaeon]